MVGLLLLKKFWYIGVIAVLLGMSLGANHRANHWKTVAGQYAEERAEDIRKFAAASAQATKANQDYVTKVDQEWSNVSLQQDKESKDAIAKANASVAAYADRMRKQAAASHSSYSGNTSVPDSATPPVHSEGPRETADIPISVGDLNICAENTVKAQTWQDFWNGVTAAVAAK